MGTVGRPKGDIRQLAERYGVDRRVVDNMTYGYVARLPETARRVLINQSKALGTFPRRSKEGSQTFPAGSYISAGLARSTCLLAQRMTGDKCTLQRMGNGDCIILRWDSAGKPSTL